MRTWVIPCNPNYYNVQEAFSKLKILDWKQNEGYDIQVGDLIYIYVGKPVQAILFKCKVNKVDLCKVEIDDHEFVIDGTNYLEYSKHMELELIKCFNDDELTFDILKQNGIKGYIQGYRLVDTTKDWCRYLLSIG